MPQTNLPEVIKLFMAALECTLCIDEGNRPIADL